MIMNISDLKLAMDAVIFKQLDHKNLDTDVEYFKNVVSGIALKNIFNHSVQCTDFLINQQNIYLNKLKNY